MESKYRQLAEILKNRLEKDIRQGFYKLPTEKELCAQFQVSRQTVRQALQLLSQEGNGKVPQSVREGVFR